MTAYPFLLLPLAATAAAAAAMSLLQDEGSTRTSSTALSSSRRADTLAALKGGAAAPAVAGGQLLKCKHKGCKLTFAWPLNQQRCQMTHLPSARTSTAKVGPRCLALCVAAVWAKFAVGVFACRL
jgi:hypothetical protein